MFLHLLILLPRLTRIYAVMESWRNDYFGEFSVTKPGRMYRHTVLMYFEKMGFEECILFCMRHQECVSISFSEPTQECELNDIKFDDTEADPHEVNWFNYYKPPIIHGQFSIWKVKTACSRTCGEGVIVYFRRCDNPRPQFGGDQCEGAYEKREACKGLQQCPPPVNVAIGKPSSQQISTSFFLSAAMANDGDITTYSMTSNQPSYWDVDLQTSVRIKYIKLFLNYDNLYGGRYRDLEVLTKDSSWSVCKFIGIPTSQQIDVTCDVASTTARYVRVKNANALLLHEVEVYA